MTIRIQSTNKMIYAIWNKPNICSSSIKVDDDKIIQYCEGLQLRLQNIPLHIITNCKPLVVAKVFIEAQKRIFSALDRATAY